MSEHLLFSTNVFLKFKICRDYRDNIHYVWCGKTFDSRVLGRYEQGSEPPPTSDPAAIYRNLKTAVKAHDLHDYKIAAQKAGLLSRAVRWEAGREVTSAKKDELIFIIENANFDDWRPLIYVIPRHVVEERAQIVPIAQRASYEEEYIIADLKGSEFDIIEI